MKKRDKKLVFSKETIRDLTTSETDAARLAKVGGGAEVEEPGTCIPGGTTHIRTVLC